MTDDEPEEGFTIRDRRRFNSEGESTAATPSASASTVTAPIAAPETEIMDAADLDDAAGGDGIEEDETALPDVYSVLAMFLGELRNLAWLRMGLVANPASGQIERDLGQARIAIDTVEFLAKKLEAVVAPEERLPLKSLVSDLQINFVEQSKRAV